MKDVVQSVVLFLQSDVILVRDRGSKSPLVSLPVKPPHDAHLATHSSPHL